MDAGGRKDFYGRDQGSRLIPLRWIAALKQAGGQPFLQGSLGRYGYLVNESSPVAGLPVGFTVAHGSGGPVMGMTCAACHTRQIEVAGSSYRIDGGPAIVDFQSFLADLDASVAAVLKTPEAFSGFAEAVLGPSPPPAEKAQLRKDLEAWHLPFHTLMAGALPAQPWGPARLDAVSMIFNRLTGLDLGPPSNSYIIKENIRVADAPVRYPFIWNAATQDQTQWPGFADNGNDILGLSRNLGEVYGVFGVFHPRKAAWWHLGIEYLNDNSANFSGLEALEDLVRKLGPPKWPWPVDVNLAEQGRAVFERPKAQGGCTECHGIRTGKIRSLIQKTWATPIQDVGTDSRQYDILKRDAQTGALNGAKIPFVTQELKNVDTAFNVLRTAVVGAIVQYKLPVVSPEIQGSSATALKSPLTPETEALKGAFNAPAPGALVAGGGIAYESRVLEGIWATAPYLHNGSVPTLAKLLTPAKDRPSEFAIGPAYDLEKVGLATDQTKFNYKLKTTDCTDRNSGNSRCGHELGTELSEGTRRRSWSTSRCSSHPGRPYRVGIVTCPLTSPERGQGPMASRGRRLRPR
jgi:hypothetical protein